MKGVWPITSDNVIRFGAEAMLCIFTRPSAPPVTTL
jgi:hypothetical protein